MTRFAFKQPQHHVYVHLVWATWNRLPLLKPDLQARIYAVIQAQCQALDCEVQALGGIEDHVHLVVKLASTVSYAHLMKEVKGASSHFANHEAPGETTFKWQGGYAAFAVCLETLPVIVRYVRNQEQHHRNRTLESQWELDD